MIARLYRSCRWFLSIGMRMYRAQPAVTSITIVSILIGQTARILSMLLPIKIIFLIGSGGIPDFFPEYLQGFQSTDLILLLSVCAGFCFLIFIATEQIIDKYVKAGAISILSRSRRIASIPREKDKLERLYYRSAKAIAELAFSLFALTALYLLDWTFGLFATTIVFCIGTVFLFYAERSERRGHFTEWSGISLPAQIQTSSSIAFFLCFTLILLQFLTDYPVNILGAVLCLLISRRLFGKLASGVTSVAALRANKALADALFFFRPYTLRQPPSTSVWSFLPGGPDWESVKQEISRTFGGMLEIKETHWIQTGIPEVLALEVEGTIDNTTRFQVLVKVYGRHRKHLADQELALSGGLASYTDVGPELLTHSETSGISTLIFDFLGYSQLTPGDIRKAKLRLSEKLLHLPVDRQIIRRFSLSNTSLGERMTSESFPRLKLVCDQGQEASLDILTSAMGDVICTVESLPLQVVTRSLNLRGMLYATPDGSYSCIHWASWSIEPIGFGWPLDHLDALKADQASDGKLSCIDINAVTLVAVLSELEYRYSRELYTDALELLPSLLSVISSMDFQSEQAIHGTQR